MKRLAFFVSLSLIGGFLVSSPAMAESAEFEIKVFPLECNIDLLHTGVNEIAQLDPEDCLPKPPGEPPVPSPEGPSDDEESPGLLPEVSSPSPQMPAGTSILPLLSTTPLEERLSRGVGYDSVPITDSPTTPTEGFSFRLFTYAIVTVVVVLTTYIGIFAAAPLLFHKFSNRLGIKRRKF